MTDSSPRIALFLFTHTPEEEAKHKRYGSGVGRKGNEAVARLLIRNSLRQARKAGLDLFVISSEAQRGDSFGERYAHAFSEIFEKGYDRVLSIGNDCPQLDAALLRKAANMLAHEAAVIGPAKDGGVYLLGLSRSAFDEQSFVYLPWQQETLGQALCAYLQPHSMGTLPILADIDHAEELNSLFQAPLLSSLLSKIRSLVLSGRASLHFAEPDLPSPLYLILTGTRRGPPAFLSK